MLSLKSLTLLPKSSLTNLRSHSWIFFSTTDRVKAHLSFLSFMKISIQKHLNISKLDVFVHCLILARP